MNQHLASEPDLEAYALPTRLRDLLTAHPLLVAVVRSLALVAIVLALTLSAQPHQPEPWFDEGLNLATAGQLAQHGVYALPDSAGPRVLDAAIQTGPTVLVPIAGVFKLFGVGVVQARAFMAVVAAAVILLYFAAARMLAGGDVAALIAVALLLLGTRDPAASYIPGGRQALGEVPALGFLLAGTMLWWRGAGGAPGNRRWAAVAGAGILWGLAAITKSQLLVILPPALIALFVLDWWYYKRAGIAAFVTAGLGAAAVIGGWYAVQIAMVGMDQFQANAAVLRQGFAIHILGLDPSSWKRALGVIWRSGWWVWGPACLAWAFVQMRRRDRAGFQYAAIVCIILAGLGWFVLFSIGWSRYAFFPLTLSPMLAGPALVALWNNGTLAKARKPVRVLTTAAALLLIAGASIGGPRVPASNDYTQMHAYLAGLPTDAVIESWDWEMDVGLANRFHHPPTPVTNAYTQQIHRGIAAPATLYDACAYAPTYLLAGAFSTWTGIYDNLIASMPQVQNFGRYTLYRFSEESCSHERP